MSDFAADLAAFDRLCGQFAFALHQSELKVYVAIALVVVLSLLLFPPENDPDQV